jgi:hypothetical protein
VFYTPVFEEISNFMVAIYEKVRWKSNGKISRTRKGLPKKKIFLVAGLSKKKKILSA